MKVGLRFEADGWLCEDAHTHHPPTLLTFPGGMAAPKLARANTGYRELGEWQVQGFRLLLNIPSEGLDAEIHCTRSPLWARPPAAESCFPCVSPIGGNVLFFLMPAVPAAAVRKSFPGSPGNCKAKFRK